MIKTTFTLTDPIFKRERVIARMEKAVSDTAELFKASTEQNMRTSVPKGRLYKRKGGFHRASAPGQRPAIDSGNLVNAIQVRQESKLQQVVDVAPNTRGRTRTPASKYAAILQFWAKRNRRIMTERDASLFKKVLNEAVDKAAGYLG